MATSPSYHGNFSNRDMPTYATVVDYFVDTRVILQDEVPPYRYKDSSLLTALNVTMLKTRRIRPDLFVFNGNTNGQVQSFTAVDDTYVEIEPQFRPSIVHGICGHALERDQEDVQDSRSSSFLAMFFNGLIGRVPDMVTGGSGPGRQQQGQGPSG